MACEPEARTEILIPKVPNDLRTPEPKPDRQADSLKDVGLLLIDYDETLDRANGKIEDIDAILTAAEAKAAPQ